jgi:hypothetical protein
VVTGSADKRAPHMARVAPLRVPWPEGEGQVIMGAELDRDSSTIHASITSPTDSTTAVSLNNARHSLLVQAACGRFMVSVSPPARGK